MPLGPSPTLSSPSEASVTAIQALASDTATHWAYERHRYHAAAAPRAPAPRRCACALAHQTQVPDALQE